MLEGLMRQTLFAACITYTYLLSCCHCVCVSGFCAKLSQQVAVAGAVARGVYVMRGEVNNILVSIVEDTAEREGEAAMQRGKMPLNSVPKTKG